MAANVCVGANGNTITVTIGAAVGSTYNPATASVTVTDNAGNPVGIGAPMVTAATPTTPALAQWTISGTPGHTYTVVVASGGDVGISSVTTTTTNINVPGGGIIIAARGARKGEASADGEDEGYEDEGTKKRPRRNEVTA